MKLRQKLAVVLASAMVLTSVPVVTMAASTNSLTRETVKVEKDAEFTQLATANSVKIKFTDHTSGKEVFYLDLENAKWDEAVLDAAAADNGSGFTKEAAGVYKLDYNNTKATYTRQSDSSMMVTVEEADVATDAIKMFPLLVKAKNGDAKVSVTTKGGTTVSTSTFVFATTSDKKLSYSVGDLNTFYKDGKLADITFEESYKGAVAGKKASVKLELADSDWVFDYQNGDTVTVEGKYGFSNKNIPATIHFSSGTDKGSAELRFDATAITGDTRGAIVVKELKVKSTNKNPEEGKFLIDIKGDDLVAEGSDVQVGTIAKYSTYIQMKDEKAAEIVAGRIEDVEYTIGEKVEDSLIGGREFEMTLENGYYDYKTLLKKYGKKGDALVTDSKGNEKEDHYQSVELDVNKLMSADLIKDAEHDGVNLITKIYFDEDTDGEIIPETLIVELDKTAQTNGNEDEMTFKLPVCVSIENKEKEKVTIKASGRALENEISTTVATIVNPFKVTSEQAVLKVGLQGQVSGSITLTETAKEMFSKGEMKFQIKDKDENVGIYLTDVTVETSGGIKGTKDEVNKGEKGNVKVTLNRSSKEASSITLKDMKFTTDRTVPEGTYDLVISGSSVDADGNELVVEDFIKIATSNTQDIASNGLAKGKATFVIGESKYTVNGKEFEMDAPCFAQNPGYTMVPVRYVANAFGISPQDILFGSGTVTIFAGERTISLTIGSNIATVNGNKIAMGTALVAKDGRTYVPASQLGNLLGIKSSWDATTKTATFINE